MFTLTCCGGWFRNQSAEEQIRSSDKNGFKAVEILGWKSMDFAKVKAAIDETGCELSAILYQSRDDAKQALIDNRHGIVHEDTFDAFLGAIEETLEAAKALNCKNIVVTTGNDREGVAREVQHGNVVKALKAAAKIVEGTGVTLVLEPLNIIVDHKGYYLTTTEEGVQIIDEVGSPNVKLLYDIYHQQITEGNIIYNIRKHIDKFGHIHLADVPGRKQPGTGELNYANIFKAIADTGYNGFVVFECGLTEEADSVSHKMWKLMP